MTIVRATSQVFLPSLCAISKHNIHKLIEVNSHAQSDTGHRALNQLLDPIPYTRCRIHRARSRLLHLERQWRQCCPELLRRTSE